MGLFITMSDFSEVRWYVGETWLKERLKNPDRFPIEIRARGEELTALFDALKLGEIERRAYMNTTIMTWNDPIAIRGILAAMNKKEEVGHTDNSCCDHYRGIG